MADDSCPEFEFLYDERVYEHVPCQASCPVHQDVEGYIRLIRQGDFHGAHLLIRETNPFPAICGRVCEHWCETTCNRGKLDKPLAIMSLKRAATDYTRNSIGLPEQRYGTREKIAIIGAGPTGLTAAADLANLGYRPTVFEAFPKPGGMMRYGIPAYRLPRETIDFEVEYIKRLGVEIRYNTIIGRDIQLKELQSEYRAVLIAAGAHKAVKLEIPGEDMMGVYYGVDFMRQVNEGQRMPHLVGKTITVIGGGSNAASGCRPCFLCRKNCKTLTTVGGGFTTMDVARSSLRLGAKKVYVVYPKIREEITIQPKEIGDAEDEGIFIRYLEVPVEIVSKDGAKATGVRLVKNKLGAPDAKGRRKTETVKGSEFVLESDYVMLAASQAPDMSFIPESSGLKLTKWGFLHVEKESFATNIPGTFATGDYVTGTRDIITVIADGHTVAISMDAYLRGAKAKYSVHKDLEPMERQVAKKTANYDLIERKNPENLHVAKRVGSFDEVERTFTKSEAMEEANRCFQCSHSWQYDSGTCILCNACVDVCPTKCLTMSQLSELQFSRLFNENISMKQQGIPGITINRAQCIRCTFCEQVCPTDSISFSCFKKELVGAR